MQSAGLLVMLAPVYVRQLQNYEIELGVEGGSDPELEAYLASRAQIARHSGYKAPPSCKKQDRWWEALVTVVTDLTGTSCGPLGDAAICKPWRCENTCG